MKPLLFNCIPIRIDLRLDLSCIFALLIVSVAASAQAAASFDCSKASNAYEKAVCKSDTLSQLDLQISHAYKQARERLATDAPALAALRQVQRDYLGMGDVMLQTRMESQLAFLRGIDGAQRQGLAGLWDLPTGGISLTPDQKGRLEITATITTGTPPNFYTCEWEGSHVSATADAASSVEGGGWTLKLTRKGSLLIAEDLPPKQDTASQPGYCTMGGRLAGVYFAAKAEPEHSKSDSAKPDKAQTTSPSSSPSKYVVIDMIKSLPTAAFENSNSGLEPAELSSLLNRGQSDNWGLKSIANTEAVFAAKVPFCEIVLTMKEIEHKSMLQVITYNRSDASYSYWHTTNKSKVLSPFYPSNLLRAYHESGKELETLPISAIPADIVKYINDGEACQHWAGEMSDDTPRARQKEITHAMAALACDQQAAQLKSLRSKYAKEQRWLTLLMRNQSILGLD